MSDQPKPMTTDSPIYQTINEEDPVATEERLLKLPNQSDMDRFTGTNASVCGECRFYAYEAGQKAIDEQRLAERMVYEQEWGPLHFGRKMIHPLSKNQQAKADALRIQFREEGAGLCGQTDGDTLVFRLGRQCGGFRANRGRIK